MTERTTDAPIPWVAGPGQKLPPAPPLWSFGEVAVLAVASGRDLDGATLAAAGWVLVVDEQGRSR
jgi:hypothetical protein